MAEAPALPEQIIDAHNHLRASWDLADVLALMDRHHVARMVLLGTPGSSASQNDAVLRAVRMHPDRFVGGAFADPRDGRRATDEIDLKCSRFVLSYRTPIFTFCSALNARPSASRRGGRPGGPRLFISIGHAASSG